VSVDIAAVTAAAASAAPLAARLAALVGVPFRTLRLALAAATAPTMSRATSRTVRSRRDPMLYVSPATPFLRTTSKAAATSATCRYERVAAPSPWMGSGAPRAARSANCRWWGGGLAERA
jgi:hypothetical protein